MDDALRNSGAALRLDFLRAYEKSQKVALSLSYGAAHVLHDLDHRDEKHEPLLAWTGVWMTYLPPLSLAVDDGSQLDRSLLLFVFHLLARPDENPSDLLQLHCLWLLWLEVAIL